MADREAKTGHEGAGQTQGPPIIGLTGPNAAGKGSGPVPQGKGIRLPLPVRRRARGGDRARARPFAGEPDPGRNELRQTFGAGILAERILLKLRREGRSPGRWSIPSGAPPRWTSCGGFPASSAGRGCPDRPAVREGLAPEPDRGWTTLEEFARKEALENSNDPAAQQLTQTLALADVVVPNDGTLEDLRARVAEALHLG